MDCPKCGGNKSRVYETVSKPDAVYRYRCCLFCNKTLKTKEVLFEGTIPQKTKKPKERKVVSEKITVHDTEVFNVWR